MLFGGAAGALDGGPGLCQNPAMKSNEGPKLVISLVAGVVLGFGTQSVLGISFRKLRSAEFLAEAVDQIQALDAKAASYKAAHGSFPADPAAMEAAGFWTPSRPPVERMRGSAQWVSTFDGEGGFVYVSATGTVYLNVDLKNDKLRGVDAERVRRGGVVPPGEF